ncbi:MAG: RcpC/CpaB family pilus assembly protein, partial [Pirellulales bacterium]|nr:RcpC/CpaB family pilus assembly protein [Pirellulales bacterium]
MPVKLTEASYKVVPKGYNVVAMKASDVSIANVIQPGDLVNVMAYFTKSELIPRSMTKTVLMGVRVYALDGDTERKLGDDRPKSLRTIQLLIHKNDAEAWTYANELGKIRLAVGNDDDYGSHVAEDGSNLAGKEFLSWLHDHQRRQEEETKPQTQANPRQSNTVRQDGTPRKDEGFVITKIVEGRIIRYRVEPGKVPRIIEDTGPSGTSIDSNDSSRPSNLDDQRNFDDQPDVNNDQSIPDGSNQEEDYSFLNGEDSPFFTPPGGQPAGSGTP